MLDAKRFELGAQPAERVRTWLARSSPCSARSREALVERGKADVEVGDQPLRGAFLLGDPRASAPSSDVAGAVQPLAERFGGFDPGAANARPGLVDQRRDGGRLGVDPAADFGQRLGRAGQQRVDRRRW